jgi:hypothetical protein
LIAFESAAKPPQQTTAKFAIVDVVAHERTQAAAGQTESFEHAVEVLVGGLEFLLQRRRGAAHATSNHHQLAGLLAGEQRHHAWEGLRLEQSSEVVGRPPADLEAIRDAPNRGFALQDPPNDPIEGRPPASHGGLDERQGLRGRSGRVGWKRGRRHSRER